MYACMYIRVYDYTCVCMYIEDGHVTMCMYVYRR